ncbi:MAG: replication-associated recombination protein A [Verrucomicrobiales bacterium]
MDDLFSSSDSLSEEAVTTEAASNVPLATRMRPRSLDEYAGQQHIIGPGKLLRRAIEADRFTSLIFYGPPGTGKTTLAQIIARQTKSRFVNLSGVESNVADIRKAAEAATTELRLHKRSTILFVDEIHRFNKAQQDVLLPYIERGTVRFIGATTQNPFFYINSPLVSRSQIFQLEPLGSEELIDLMRRSLMDVERGFGKVKTTASGEALRHIATLADGDARKALNALELAVTTTPAGADGAVHVNLAVAEESVQRKTVVYDGQGDAHYDTISAFIKSIRGSDPDAAVYWLAKMLYAGEDPRFIARRIIIAASEDIGLADSNALTVAVAAQQAVEFVGMPEGRIPLAHATVYLATAPKSNSAYAALGAATEDIQNGRTLAVPPYLKDSHVPGHKGGYKYAHNFEGNYVPQAYLPEGRRFYSPSENGAEKQIIERLEHWRAIFERGSDRKVPQTSRSAGPQVSKPAKD